MMCLLRNVHPFLAVNQPAAADVLVVEGWIPQYALQQCSLLITTGKYQRVVTVGGPISGVRPPAADDDTYAYVAARFMQKMGQSAIEIIPSNLAARDRTFRCASDLKQWLALQQLTPRAVNVVTLGPHARRSRLLFQKAFGDETEVGVIAIDNAEYDAREWWRYSEGIKEVISEFTAYIYARFLFNP
jgi:hypothetical protein